MKHPAQKGPYPGEFNMGGPKHKLYDWNGEYRPPRKGEYFLSGADVIAYLAPNDLSTPYFIAKEHTPVKCPHCGSIR